jgi:hypothetical protein
MNEEQRQHEARHRRRKEEFFLGKQFVDTVMLAGKSLDSQRSNKLAKGLTKFEEPVFRKHTYYNWTYGMIAGVSIAAALVGVTRWRGRSKLRLPSATVSEDAILRATATTTAPIKQRSLTDEIVTEVQMITFGAIAAVTTVVTASLSSDYRRLFRELAVVPLQPGKSYLCAHMCPQLIQQAKSLTPEQKKVWDDPETEELESIRKMVYNCEQRMLFEQDQRSRLNLDREDQNVVMDVPEPGVPVRYQY